MLHSLLLVLGQDGVHLVEGDVDVFSDFGTGDDDFAGDEDQEDDLGLTETVDQTGEQLQTRKARSASHSFELDPNCCTHLRFVARELMMLPRKPLQPDRKLDITTPHDILDLELLERRAEPELLHNPGVLPGSQARVVFGFGAGHDHLARGEDEGGGLGVSDAHDDGGESL